MTPKDERQQATAMERQVFDSLAAISYCLAQGTVGSMAMRTVADGSIVSLMPLKPQENPKAVEHFTGSTLLEAFVAAGRKCDTEIHKAQQAGADVQGYLQSKDALQKLRTKPLIVVPNN